MDVICNSIALLYFIQLLNRLHSVTFSLDYLTPQRGKENMQTAARYMIGLASESSVQRTWRMTAPVMLGRFHGSKRRIQTPDNSDITKPPHSDLLHKPFLHKFGAIYRL